MMSKTFTVSVNIETVGDLCPSLFSYASLSESSVQEGIFFVSLIMLSKFLNSLLLTQLTSTWPLSVSCILRVIQFPNAFTLLKSNFETVCDPKILPFECYFCLLAKCSLPETVWNCFEFDATLNCAEIVHCIKQIGWWYLCIFPPFHVIEKLLNFFVASFYNFNYTLIHPLEHTHWIQ